MSAIARQAPRRAASTETRPSSPARYPESITPVYDYVALTNPQGTTPPSDDPAKLDRAEIYTMSVAPQSALNSEIEVSMKKSGSGSDRINSVELVVNLTNKPRWIDLTLDVADQLRPGRYTVGGVPAPASIDDCYDRLCFSPKPNEVIGTVDIVEVDLHRMVFGHRAPSVAFTFELDSPNSDLPILGAAGVNEVSSFTVPGITQPPQVSPLQRAGKHGAVLSWQPSHDIAVHDYVMRRASGVHGSVALRGGTRVYSGPHTSARIPSSVKHPVTVTVYAVDDLRHASRGRTVVVR
ncbi:MAG TPA: hypothetical protein VFE19_06010 [Jatrophihabitantaceae bacterium]|jgi:hypothetical protein|nr:hypothetical protein [Jatrophihabitantaceae bacterium]